MTKPRRTLTIDEAVGAFMALSEQEDTGLLPDGGGPAPSGPLSQPEKEAALFHLAAHLVRLACPDPAACSDQRCRREALCRHSVYLHDRRVSGVTSHPRRTPGAEAARYAMWVYMSSRPDG